MAAWSRVDVLIIDDLVLQPATLAQAADLLEVIEDRSQRRSTIVTSQLPIAEWHEALGDPTLADAILDRLTNHAHRIESRRDFMRRRDPENAADGLSSAESAGDRRKTSFCAPSAAR
jgi:DNA replication protein DnaC